MEHRILYNFSGLETAMSHLKQGLIKKALPEIERELNKFFKDSTCSKVIFTRNTDKLFFGMTTYCVLTPSETYRIINSDDRIRVEKYYIEIDSKLMEIGLNTRELTAFLLHEVGHVVNDSSPVDEVRAAVDYYLADNHEVINIKQHDELSYMFAYAINDSIRKSRSLFTRNDQEILADEFVFRCGYGSDLESGFRKLTGSAININKEVDNKFIVLQWTLRIYSNIGMHRLGAIKTLNRAAQLSGSSVERDAIVDVVKHLKSIKLSKLNEAIISETDKGLVAKIRRGGLKGIEEDVYEYQLRIRNVDDENEAIILMRQINTRMSVLDEYLYNSEKINEGERKRWEKVLAKYELLREELAKKTVYNANQYGIWLDYNYANAMDAKSDPYYR